MMPKGFAARLKSKDLPWKIQYKPSQVSLMPTTAVENFKMAKNLY